MTHEVRLHLRLSVIAWQARALLAALLLVALPIELGSETLTLITTYPAPMGVYYKMITTDDTYLARDGGKVGIGTPSPTQKLDINGNIRMAGEIFSVGTERILDIRGYNVHLGWSAGKMNTSLANGNVFVGHEAGLNSTGGENVLLGKSAGISSTIGNKNTFLGATAGYSHTGGGGWNVYLGAETGFYSQTGSDNTFLGAAAGHSNEVGSGNVFIGSRAGFMETGVSNRLYIANSATVTPLVYGRFDTNLLRINGRLEVTDEIFQGGVQRFPDYVFEPGHDIMPLKDLEDFVLKNKHLPGMPTAKEAREEGIKLFEQNRLLLEKLEEAYRYIFELKNRVEKLETKH